MSEIPDDIMKAVSKAYFDVFAESDHASVTDLIRAIATVVDAERQRNAFLIEEVRKVIEPFAKLMPDTTRVNGTCCKDYEDSRPFIVVDPISCFDFTMGDIRAARAILEKLGGGNGSL